MTVAEEVAGILLDIKAITLSPGKPYRFSSGILSPVYSDLRQFMGYPKQRRAVIKHLAALIREIGIPDFVAGTAMGAIPHAAWVSDVLDIPMVYVRNKPKDHGKQNLVEGFHKPGQTAIIIEDLISTGQSSLVSVKALRDIKCQVSTIAAIITYTMPAADKNFKDANVTLRNLTDFPTVVKVAAARKEIKETDQKVVLEWLKDSAGWGKKMGFE